MLLSGLIVYGSCGDARESVEINYSSTLVPVWNRAGLFLLILVAYCLSSALTFSVHRGTARVPEFLYLSDLGFLSLQSLNDMVTVLRMEMDSLLTFCLLPISASSRKLAILEHFEEILVFSVVLAVSASGD